MIKINFDGVSKGNLGPTRGGGFFRNEKGEIIHIYALNLRNNTNNATKLTSLVEGIKIAAHNGYHKLIMEGDTDIIITICRKIINGTPPDKNYHS